ncbi:MAG TPA: HEAT repeat domain-containing protein [Candidatus Dormibacteraeota bacterium]|nr:HEAT repeat domain-containing protein [Candidatus Dormibacteraeota bacterium]
MCREAAAIGLRDAEALASGAAPLLERALGDSDWRLRLVAAEALANLTSSDRPIDVTIELLSHPDDAARVRAVELLSRLPTRDQRSIEPLLNALGDDTPMVRESAATALGNVERGSDRILAALRSRLSDENDGVVVAAGAAYYHLVHSTLAEGSEQIALSAITDVLRYTYYEQYRRQAVRELGRIGFAAQRALPYIQRFWHHSNSQEAQEAYDAVRSICPTAVCLQSSVHSLLLDPHASDAARLNMFQTMVSFRGQLPSKTVTELNHLMHDKDGVLRTRAMGALYRNNPQNKTVLGMLINELKSVDPITRWSAGSVLAEIGTEAAIAIPTLRMVLIAHPEPSIARALWKVSGEVSTAVEALTGILKDPRLTLPALDDAAKCLGEMGPAARPATGSLVNAMEEWSGMADLAIAEALWRIEGSRERVLPIVTAKLQSPIIADQKRAADLAGEIGAEATTVLPTLLDVGCCSVEPVRSAVFEAIEKIDPNANYFIDLPSKRPEMERVSSMARRGGVAMAVVFSVVVLGAQIVVVGRKNGEWSRNAVKSIVVSMCICSCIILLSAGEPRVLRCLSGVFGVILGYVFSDR